MASPLLSTIARRWFPEFQPFTPIIETRARALGTPIGWNGALAIGWYQPRGWWEVLEVDAPRSLVFRDGFANDDGSPNPDLPVTRAGARQPPPGLHVRALVPHEPPLPGLLPDREHALAANRAIHETYLGSGYGPAMAKFIALVSHKGPFPVEFADQPAPDPPMSGLPTEDDGCRNDSLLGQVIVSSTHYEPDFDALRAASTRIVVAAGAGSEGEHANRAAHAVAERLGTAPVTFPGGHGGFLGGEHGQTGEPEAFAAALREVLQSA